MDDSNTKPEPKIIYIHASEIFKYIYKWIENERNDYTRMKLIGFSFLLRDAFHCGHTEALNTIYQID
jgi:hypothetical protein